MFYRWTLRDMLNRERDLRIEAEIRTETLTAQVQALTVIAQKQVDDLELSPEEREQVGKFIELKPEKPGIGEIGKG